MVTRVGEVLRGFNDVRARENVEGSNEGRKKERKKERKKD
jgi:hypothetical protein